MVLVGAGTYVESVRIRSSAAPRAPITLRGQKGARLVGAAALEAPAGAAVWQQVEGDLYKTSRAPRTRYVAVGGKRLYYWKTLELLRRGSETRREKTYSVKGGWTQASDGALYVRLPEGQDPRRVGGIQVARHNDGIVLDGARHVIVEGLDVGLFGQHGVVIRNSSGCVVRNSVIHNSRHGISIVGTASTQNLIEGCEVYDTSVWEWPWQLCKAHDPEGAAIYLQAGRGNVIRRNRIHGYFNALVPSMWGKLDDERFNGDLDIHDNEMWDVGDDCLEPEGSPRA